MSSDFFFRFWGVVFIFFCQTVCWFICLLYFSVSLMTSMCVVVSLHGNHSRVLTLFLRQR